jgi:hypothetical protein
LDFRFCRFYPTGNDYHFWSGIQDWPYFDSNDFEASFDSAVYLTMQDCSVHGGHVNLGMPDYYYFYPTDEVYAPGAVTWVNNFFDQVNIYIVPTFHQYGWDDNGLNVDLAFHAHNNLFRGGAWLALEPIPASAGNWTLTDNLFDKVDFLQDYYMPLDFTCNAYWPKQPSEMLWPGLDTSQLLPTTTGDGFTDSTSEPVFAAAPPYQSGPFGDYYMPTNTILYQAGSRTADAAGLCQYTTQTNQTKETPGQTADIGLHYVAASNSPGGWVPMDTDSDGIPDYVEDANGNGVVDSGETDPTTQYTVSGIWDPTNIVYNNIDLSGDGLVGRVKEALGMNPFDTNNPLTATQIITGAEPSIATFEVPINYSALTNFARVQILVDGGPRLLQECFQGSDGNAQINWNTTYNWPGQHYIQVKLTLTQSSPTIGDPEQAVYSALGNLAFYTISNVLEFDPVYSEYDAENGAVLYASLTGTNADYTIELLTLDGTHLTTITNSTSTGFIMEYWDLTDDNGNTYTNGPVAAVFNVTLLDPGSGGATQIINGPARGVAEGAFVTACCWDLSSEFQDIQSAVQNEVNLTLSPGAFGLSNPYYSYNAINDAQGEGYVNGKSGFLSSQADMDSLVTNYLANMSTRNFYFRGHGNNKRQIGNNIDGPGGIDTDYLKVGLALTNLVSHTGYGTNYNNFIARGHPYRFVWLDACDTANDDGWASAFGIYDTMTANQITQKGGAQAFVGWVNEPRAPIGDDEWNNYGTMLGVFYFQWMKGATLNACLPAASDSSLLWPMGNKFSIVQQIAHPFSTSNNFKYQMFGYGNITRTGSQ